MIEIKFEELAIIIVSASLLCIGLLLFLHRSRSLNHRRRRRYQVVNCPVCGAVFEDVSSEKLPKCPGCGRKTLRGDDRSLG